MAFIKADIEKEQKELEKLIESDDSARKAYEDFQTRISLQRQLISKRKSENMTQADVARTSGLSQQAVSRIEKGSGATINSLIKYLRGIGYSIELRKN
jgi:DNA-binding XRE family transcriptional regulator